MVRANAADDVNRSDEDDSLLQFQQAGSTLVKSLRSRAIGVV